MIQCSFEESELYPVYRVMPMTEEAKASGWKGILVPEELLKHFQAVNQEWHAVQGALEDIIEGEIGPSVGGFQ